MKMLRTKWERSERFGCMSGYGFELDLPEVEECGLPMEMYRQFYGPAIDRGIENAGIDLWVAWGGGWFAK